MKVIMDRTRLAVYFFMYKCCIVMLVSEMFHLPATMTGRKHMRMSNSTPANHGLSASSNVASVLCDNGDNDVVADVTNGLDDDVLFLSITTLTNTVLLYPKLIVIISR